ncbi:MAG: PAS domain-containing protein [Verrucomicrobiota bacterium]
MHPQDSIASEIQYHRTIIDAMPCPIFVVEEDVRIVDFNTAAGELLQQERKATLRQRAGEMFHCIHAIETPDGCGKAPACATCPIRNGVNLALQGGTPPRQTAKLELLSESCVTEALFLITVAPLVFETRRLALVVLEDVREITLLRQMLPICSHCKQVRDDANYWQSVETYLATHLDIDCTHSLCPECVGKLFPEYAQALGVAKKPAPRPALSIAPIPPDAA